MTSPRPGEIEVEDRLERRIRKPVDLMRCILSCIEIVALALAGVAASQTTAAVQADIVGATRQVPASLLQAARPLALMARDLKRAIMPGGAAVLAGLLRRQEALVLAAHRAQGLSLERRLVIEGWSTLVLRSGPKKLDGPV